MAGQCSLVVCAAGVESSSLPGRGFCSCRVRLVTRYSVPGLLPHKHICTMLLEPPVGNTQSTCTLAPLASATSTYPTHPYYQHGHNTHATNQHEHQADQPTRVLHTNTPVTHTANSLQDSHTTTMLTDSGVINSIGQVSIDFQTFSISISEMLRLYSASETSGDEVRSQEEKHSELLGLAIQKITYVKESPSEYRAEFAPAEVSSTVISASACPFFSAATCGLVLYVCCNSWHLDIRILSDLSQCVEHLTIDDCSLLPIITCSLPITTCSMP